MGLCFGEGLGVGEKTDGLCLRLGVFVEEWAGDVSRAVAKEENGIGDDFLGMAFCLWKALFSVHAST